MGIFKRIIEIVNANVYGTNLLLVPAMVICLLVVEDINIWSNYKDENENVDEFHINIYKSIWYILSFIFLITIFFSTVYHFSMFSKYNILRQIGKIDYKYTAPLLGFILLIMNLMYIYYIIYNCKEKNKNENDVLYIMENNNKYRSIYYISLACTLFGSISYVIQSIYGYTGRKYTGLRSNTFIHKIKYISSHTFFHYVGYTGISILMILYYLENKEIFEYYFIKKCYKNIDNK